MCLHIRELPQGIRLAHYEPGNDTCYKAIAVPWHDSEYQLVLGSGVDGWLVISCNSGRAYIFQASDHDYLPYDEYIQDSLGGLDRDYPYFGDMIRKLLSREEG